MGKDYFIEKIIYTISKKLYALKSQIRVEKLVLKKKLSVVELIIYCYYLKYNYYEDNVTYFIRTQKETFFYKRVD